MDKLSKKQSSSFKVFGKLEKEVMEIIWRYDMVTVREVFEEIKKKRKIAYTTVMTILDRLFEKGILKRKKQGKTYLYDAKSTKNDFIKKTSRKIINDLVSDFGDVALAQFANTLDNVDPKKLGQLKEKIRGK